MLIDQNKLSKTNLRLLNAMSDMLKHSCLDDITIKALTHQANVTRSTFYTYYNDKQELFKTLVKFCYSEAYFPLRNLEYAYSKETGEAELFDKFKKVLDSIFSNQHVIKHAHTSYQPDILCEFIQLLSPEIKKQILFITQNNNKHIDNLTIFYIHGLFAVLHFWIRNGFNTPVDDLAEQLTTMTLSTFNSFNLKYDALK